MEAGAVWIPCLCISEVKAPAQGYISHMDTEGIGTASVLLGAGRNTKRTPLIMGPESS